MTEFNFNPELCRNETEVESKLIVHYLLPKLGYTPDTWHQEVTFGKIRLDFLAFATQVLPFVVDANSPLSIIMEAKSPTQNLERHVQKFKNYLVHLHVKYGVLTNGKQLRIYERLNDTIQLRFECKGQEIHTKIQEITNLIGRENLKFRPDSSIDHFSKVADSSVISSKLETATTQPVQTQPLSDFSAQVKRKSNVKIIAIYHNKGGVGKTTTVINLAAALRKKGKRVLVIDMDSQANTTFAAGLIKFDDEEFDNLKDCNVRHVLQSEEFYLIPDVAKISCFNDPEIDVIASHITLMQYENELNQIDTSKVRLVNKLKLVKDNYDIVVIDTPPSLNLYARTAIITADYLIIPSDLKPFANQGLSNVKELLKKCNEFKSLIGKPPINILGVLPCKISTNSRYVEYTLPKHIKAVTDRYNLPVMDSRIFQREELSKCLEQTEEVGEHQIPNPISVLDFKPDGESAREFERLAVEVLKKIGR